jgi:hypothetical protein
MAVTMTMKKATGWMWIKSRRLLSEEAVVRVREPLAETRAGKVEQVEAERESIPLQDTDTQWSHLICTPHHVCKSSVFLISIAVISVCWTLLGTLKSYG